MVDRLRGAAPVAGSPSPGIIQRAPGGGLFGKLGGSSKPKPVDQLFPDFEAAYAGIQAGAPDEKRINKALGKIDKYRSTAQKDGRPEARRRFELLAAELQGALDMANMPRVKSAVKEQYLRNDASDPSHRLNALSAMAQGSWGNAKVLSDLRTQLPATGMRGEMHDADLQALKLYSGHDYKYVNPAVANSQGWMTSQVKSVKEDPNLPKGIDYLPGTDRDRFQEGALHAGMMMEAFRALPNWTGTTYRGERLTPSEFAAQYDDAGGAVTAKQQTSVKSAFWSSSRSRAVAEQFARGEGDSPPADDKTVSMLYEIEVVRGTDLQQFSAVPREEEVLLPPGSAITITAVRKLPTRGTGTPTSTAEYVVTMRQLDKAPDPAKASQAPPAGPAGGVPARPDDPMPAIPAGGMPALPAAPNRAIRQKFRAIGKHR